MVAYISNTNWAAINLFEISKVHYHKIDFHFYSNMQSVEWTISAKLISLSKVDLQNFQSMNKLKILDLEMHRLALKTKNSIMHICNSERHYTRRMFNFSRFDRRTTFYRLLSHTSSIVSTFIDWNQIIFNSIFCA